ncbi:MAG TPA: glycosyltransferase family 39 protein, partial [Anaerolineae bacterium]|nr:glycosyltransferase family 39 protein [Anaerolineae bacterium]
MRYNARGKSLVAYRLLLMVSTASSSTPSVSLVTQRAIRILPYALIFLALLVRLHGLTFQSLWRDEVDAICFAQAPLLPDLPQTALSFTPTCPPNIPDLLAAFTQPGFNGPLYFLILRGAIGLFGYSEFALRFFSLLCGVISVALIITLGTRLFNRAVGLIAGALLTLSAYQVWYSQEAKMYTLITLLTLASIYFLRRAVEEGCLRFWIGVVACTSLAMGSHILAALLIPVQVIVFLLWWPQSRHHLIAGAISLACVTLPYLPVGVDRLKWAFEPAVTGFASYTLGDMLGVLGQAYTRGIFSSLDGQAVALALAVAASLAIFGLLSIDSPLRPASRPDRVLSRLSVFAWAAIPTLAIALISINRPLFTDRYLIWIQAAFYLAVALGVYALWNWIKPLGALALIALLIVNTDGLLLQSVTPFKSDFRAAAHAIEREIKPDDLVVFQIPHVRHTFDYYFRRPYQALGGPYTNYTGDFNG